MGWISSAARRTVFGPPGRPLIPDYGHLVGHYPLHNDLHPVPAEQGFFSPSFMLDCGSFSALTALINVAAEMWNSAALFG